MASLNRWLERRRNPWKGPFFDAYKAWRRDKGQSRLSVYTDLAPGSVAFDFGGFKGAWTDDVLASQPDCEVHIFEPHPRFAAELQNKFSDKGNVHVHAFALGAQDGTLTLSDEGDASSSVAKHDRSFEAEIKSVHGFFADHDIAKIDLAKMNIEGGEYDLLPALFDDHILPRIARLQIQFHLFDPSLVSARDSIRAQLGRSHKCDWVYPFVWEQWSLKSSV